MEPRGMINNLKKENKTSNFGAYEMYCKIHSAVDH